MLKKWKTLKNAWFLLVFWDVAGVKNEENSIKNRWKMKIFWGPGWRAIFHRFGIDFGTILGTKMGPKIEEKALKF